MKLSVPSFFSSSSKNSSSNKKQKKTPSTISHSDPSSFASSDASTPQSVLLPSSADFSWSSSSSSDLKISRQELEAALRRLSPDPPSEDDVAAILDDYPSVCAGAEEEELREAFGVFDADGDGRISAEELLGVFAALGDDKCTLEDCRRMIDGVDTDGDGFVSFGDFVRMMDGQR